MYKSMKRQQRIHGPTRRTICCKPTIQGRVEPPAADETELAYIERAIAVGDPIYFVRHVNGGTLDVSINKAKSLRMRDAINDRIGRDKIQRIQVFERLGIALSPVIA